MDLDLRNFIFEDPNFICEEFKGRPTLRKHFYLQPTLRKYFTYNQLKGKIFTKGTKGKPQLKDQK